MSLHSLSKKWNDSKGEDVYASVEEFAEEVSSAQWPYAIIADQIESGWTTETRGALALNLVRNYSPEAHGLAVFMTLGGPWPKADATAAINLLSLVHRAHPVQSFALGRLVSHVALYCLRRGLEDERPVVSEQAVNVLGGLGPAHLYAASDGDLTTAFDLAKRVISGVGDKALADALYHRVGTSLSDAPARRGPLFEAEIASILNELDPLWEPLATTKSDPPIVAILRTHLTALAWRFASSKPGAIQALYAYSSNPDDEKPTAYRVMDPWFRFVRDLILPTDMEPVESVEAPARAVYFNTLNATGGSLLVTLRVSSDSDLDDAISKELRAVRDKPPTGSGAKELAELLTRGDLHVRVAHIESDLTSTSLALSPTPKKEDIGMAPLRSRKLATIEIPQANELERVIRVVDSIATSASVTPGDIGVSTMRQVQYYKAAARLLELITASGAEVTRAGWLLHAAQGDDRFKRVCAAFEASPCGQSWIEWANVTKLKDVPADSAAEFLAARSELTGDTISRRANTLNVWLEALRRYS